MTLTLPNILAMVRRTVSNPREGASEVLSLGVPREALGLIVALVVVLSVIMTEISAIGASLRAGESGVLAISPIMAAMIQLAVILGMGTAVHVVGRAMGGTGSFPEALLLVAWLQFIMVCIQVIQIAAVLVMPPLSSIIFFAALLLFFWLLTNFVAVLHGFRNLGQVFAMILVTAFALGFFLSLALTILGIGVPMQTGSV